MLGILLAEGVPNSFTLTNLRMTRRCRSGDEDVVVVVVVVDCVEVVALFVVDVELVDTVLALVVVVLNGVTRKDNGGGGVGCVGVGVERGATVGEITAHFSALVVLLAKSPPLPLLKSKLSSGVCLAACTIATSSRTKCNSSPLTALSSFGTIAFD